MDVILHFNGLAEGAHTWFYNCRGAMVFIRPGDFVIVDTNANPFWEAWIERKDARQVDEVPVGADFLYENSEPKPPNIPAPWGDDPPPLGAFVLCGPISDPDGIVMTDGTTCTVLDLTPDAIERIRQSYMPRDLPGIAYTDARRDKRGGMRAHTLPPPFEMNFFVLIRLAWLMCRADTEAELRGEEQEWATYQRQVRDLGLPEDPVRRPGRGEIRGRVEDATSNLLSEWGDLRGDRLPNRVTVYRAMKSAYLTVDDIDRAILMAWRRLVDPDAESQIVQFSGSTPPEAQ